MAPTDNSDQSQTPSPESGPKGVTENDKQNKPAGIEISEKHLLVCWDMDTTGRRLMDEICHIGGKFNWYEEEKDDRNKKDKKEEKATSKGDEARDENENLNNNNVSSFSQYVMPHKNPNPGARRSFGLRVVSIGRYRMLKDMQNGKVLKTKSEISALQDFLKWLDEALKKSGKEKAILACHEPNRKVLIPLLLEAIKKYNLIDSLEKTVAGFLNVVGVVEQFGDKNQVTSHSLRSLCRTLLGDTNPETANAFGRCKVLNEILKKMIGNEMNSFKVCNMCSGIAEERTNLDQLKSLLAKQGSLRPIFEKKLKLRRTLREHAIGMRKILAENQLDYDTLKQTHKDQKSFKMFLEEKVSSVSQSDIEDLAKLLEEHFNEEDSKSASSTTATSNSKSSNNKKKLNNNKKNKAKTEKVRPNKEVKEVTVSVAEPTSQQIVVNESEA